MKKTKGLDRFLLIFILIGIALAFISLFRGIVMDRQVQVEYLSGGNPSDESGNLIFVDIEGAITHPGVYEMRSGERVKDVLIKSGGFTVTADREFCEKNINLAEEIKDGQKIYIPSGIPTPINGGHPEAISGDSTISINSATMAELDTLWGVGPAKAESIVKNRPYQSIQDLVTKKVLSQSIIDHNTQLLSVY